MARDSLASKQQLWVLNRAGRLFLAADVDPDAVSVTRERGISVGEADTEIKASVASQEQAQEPASRTLANPDVTSNNDMSPNRTTKPKEGA